MVSAPPGAAGIVDIDAQRFDVGCLLAALLLEGVDASLDYRLAGGVGAGRLIGDETRLVGAHERLVEGHHAVGLTGLLDLVEGLALRLAVEDRLPAPDGA